jgi:hypothetical protein
MALRRNILIFHLGALGDFIVTWPLALTLARLYPQSRVFYVTHGQKGALAERVLRVESTDIEGSWHELFNENPRLPEQAQRMLAGAHTVISFLSNSADRWAANVRHFSGGANVVSLTTAAPETFSGHISEFLIEQLRSWPAAHTAAGQILRSIMDRGLAVPRVPSGRFLVHPGSGSPAKNWPAERYLELVKRLRAGGHPVRVIVGEVERERWPSELLKRFEAVAELAHPPILIDLLNEITAASTFIGNDSGPAHLAGVLGLPTIALFAGPDTTRWKPLGPRVHAIPGPLEEIAVDAVLDAMGEADNDKDG